MDTYSLLRAFADSWFLIAMFSFFLGAWAFAFWPSLKADRDAAAQIPLLDDPAPCRKNCATCACKLKAEMGPQNG